MTIRFKYTILYVNDVVQEIEFYEKAFSFTRKFITPDNTYGELLTGDTTLSFAALSFAATNFEGGFRESDPAKQPFAMEVGFATDDVPATLKQAIAAGGKLVSEPKTKPWGQVVAYVRDPAGFLVEICTPTE